MDPYRRHKRDLRMALVVLLAVLAAGCSPKRVVQGRVETVEPSSRERSAAVEPAGRGEPSPRTDTVPDRETEQEPVAGLELPGPKPRGRSGTAPVRRTATEVDLGVKAATLAREQLGKPYQWGATGPDKFDCSGLVWHVYGQLGVQVPRVSRAQSRAGREIGRSELQPGDLVFFATEGQVVNHVGIYVGESDFVHAPRRYQPVKTDSLNNSWWRRRYKGARRVP